MYSLGEQTETILQERKEKLATLKEYLQVESIRKH